METLIKLKPSELEIALQKLKILIQGDENIEIKITVKNFSKVEEFFECLGKSINEIENNHNLVPFSFNEFQGYSKSLAK